jgi:hypothetical protein
VAITLGLLCGASASRGLAVTLMRSQANFGDGSRTPDY